jgi:hypothetical protein
MFVNVAIEFPLQHEPAHVMALKNKRAIEDALCALAAEAGATNPHALAQELCMIMDGAYVTRVVTGNKNAVDIARRIAKHAIAAHCRSAAWPAALDAGNVERDTDSVGGNRRATSAAQA